ncbi:hypothetical protein ACWENQ_06440 [Nonomuraea sp. NPDC004354]
MSRDVVSNSVSEVDRHRVAVRRDPCAPAERPDIVAESIPRLDDHEVTPLMS